MRKLLVLTILVAIAGSSCVSTKKYNEARAEVMRMESEYRATKMRAEELANKSGALKKELDGAYGELKECELEYIQLEERYKRLLSDGSGEASRMLKELEQTQADLSRHLSRVEDLEQKLKGREEAIDQIRREVSDALIGFDGKGLSISTRQGKVYVSMEDRLLFKSGRFDVDPQGAAAIKELGVVLANNPEINVMVEGHTDDVPYRSSGQLKDNLDLSVMRATTVTRLLLENADIDPVRIISAGRGEYLPVATGSGKEARGLNRRTEIILTPKLDELLQLLDR